MKIYLSNIKKDGLGGGWTFLRNFKKSLKDYVQFVDRWEDCDIFFISGVTMTDKNDVKKAKEAGKKIVFRVDNVPRKSRNTRCTPHDRMKSFANDADLVIYQSAWAKEYCFPLTGEGKIIYNGVDEKIFYPSEDPIEGRDNNYLFVYHGNSELKGFWIAHSYFQALARVNPDAVFNFIYDFKNLDEIQKSNYDFWNGEKYNHFPKIEDPNLMAVLMRKHKYLICPSIADASPNIVLEARACGLKVIHNTTTASSGVAEMLNKNLVISIERMAQDYLIQFKKLL